MQQEGLLVWSISKKAGLRNSRFVSVCTPKDFSPVTPVNTVLYS